MTLPEDYKDKIEVIVNPEGEDPDVSSIMVSV